MSADQNPHAWYNQQPGNNPPAYNPTPAYNQPPGYSAQPGYNQPPGYAPPLAGAPAPLTGAAATGALWCIVGGATVALGSLLPFISNATAADGLVQLNVSAGDRAASVIFGALLILFGVLARRRLAAAAAAGQRGSGNGFAVTVTVLSCLGALGYLIFTAVGLAGFNEQDNFGGTDKVSFSPSIGLILCIIGCVVAAYGSIRIISSRRTRPMTPPSPMTQWPG